MEIINGMINTFCAMEMTTKIIIFIALAIITLGILYVAICFIWFVLQEIHHSIKNAKRSFKEAMWELEWNLNYDKRHHK
jgi:hypothetical protein